MQILCQIRGFVKNYSGIVGIVRLIYMQVASFLSAILCTIEPSAAGDISAKTFFAGTIPTSSQVARIPHVVEYAPSHGFSVGIF